MGNAPAGLLLIPALLVLFLVVGVWVAVLGRRQRSAAGIWWRTSVETTGVVVSSRMETFSQGSFGDGVDSASAVMLPTVRFRLANGQEVVAESTQGHNFTARNGKTVPVHYQPSDPLHPRVGRMNISKANGTGMLVLGCSFIFMAMFGMAICGLIGLLLWFSQSGSP